MSVSRWMNHGLISLLYISLFFLCAASPTRQADFGQARLDYKTDIDALYAIADDYEDQPGFQELLMHVPRDFAFYNKQMKFAHGDLPDDMEADYIRKVALLTSCVSALDEEVVEKLPASCEKLKDGK